MPMRSLCGHCGLCVEKQLPSNVVTRHTSITDTMRNWIYLAITILGEVVATSALKSSNGFTKPIPSAIVIIGYGFAFYFLSLALRSIPVGVAYAIWAGVGIVLVATIAWIFHGQKLDLWAMIGIGLIISGVAVLNLFSRSGTH